MINSIFFLLLLCFLLVSGFLFVSALQHFNYSNKAYFIVFIVCVFIFLLGYMLEISASTTEGAFYCCVVFYIGGSYAAPFFLLFIADYCEITIKRQYIAALIAAASAMPVLVATSSYQKLFFAEYSFCNAHIIRHLQIIPGPLFYICHIFAYFCVFAGGIMLIRYSLKSNMRLKRQAYLIFAGSLLPVASNIVFLLGFQRFGVNLTPFSMAIVMILFYIELVYNHISRLAPKADEHVLSVMRDAFLVVDGEQRFLKANSVFFSIFPEITGITEGQAIEHVDGWPQELRELSLLEQNKREKEFSIERNGEVLSYSASVSRITSGGTLIGWSVLLHDITETVRLIRKLENIAYTDGLTGIFNRAHFLKTAELEFLRAQRMGSPVSIIILDLDFFKNINDTYGHSAGDKVLKGVTQNILSVIRPYNLFARYGGEEFIILSDTDVQNSAMLAERVRKAISDGVYLYFDTLIKCTASFGVAERTEASQSLSAVIGKADIALYLAKNNGRNCVMLYDENGLLPEIMHAVKSNFDSFMLYYQPIFSTSTDKLVGAEALLRLRLQKGDLLLPHSLLPVLEKLGNMQDVEKWVINTACEQCKKWEEYLGREFYVHVNLSQEMLNSGELYETVISALLRSGLDPHSLVLSFKVFNSSGDNNNCNTLELLRKKNVRIAADSFGKGYTPLVEFKHLDVDEIRIDRSFVVNIDRDLHSFHLLEGIVRMLESVDRMVSVVGVETQTQKRCLSELGVDLLQGYLLGRPVDASSFEETYLNGGKQL